MIRRKIQNDFIYAGEKDGFANDSYVRHYIYRLYFCGILVYKYTLEEDISRKKETNNQIGFQK
jgi:hypothetical protein